MIKLTPTLLRELGARGIGREDGTEKISASLERFGDEPPFVAVRWLIHNGREWIETLMVPLRPRHVQTLGRLLRDVAEVLAGAEEKKSDGRPR
jgi:hypothetical protein